MALSRTTRDHDEIRKWAEAHGAVPAEVGGTEADNQTGILRFEFPSAPNHNDSKLKEISWDDFFEKFDQNNLELLYQEKTADGEKSNFNKLIHPESEEHSAHASRKSAGAAAEGGSAKKTAKSSGSKKHKAA